LGHDVSALDQLADAADGLGAIRLYPASVVAVQASFDAPPFAPAQFDVVVFNGSLHYAPDIAATLRIAWRMRTPGGAVAVIDSPMFRHAEDGDAMVADLHRRFRSTYGLGDVERPGAGYLTFDALSAVARDLGAAARFIPSRGPVGWRVRRAVARVRLGREPARFGVWVAR
jgi:SAM-dependent methyltransferase